jgi:hypothetical protein
MVGKGQMTAECSLYNFCVYFYNTNRFNKQADNCDSCGVGEQRIKVSGYLALR